MPDRQRRRLLLASAALAALPQAVWANLPPTRPVPQLLPEANWRRWGSGVLRRFGFRVYEATLWAAAGEPLRPPYALELRYALDIASDRLASTSVDEMRRLGRGDAARLASWGEQLRQLFPSVKAGERIVGVHLPEGARFYHQDKLISSVADPEFANAFFAIWLDPKTSAPEVRAALLRGPEDA